MRDDFWDYVAVGELDECWPWLGRLTSSSYGRCSTKYGNLSPHRVAWERWHGVQLGELHACHSCDFPPCCNPRHIFPGTPLDNMQDYLGKFGHRRSMLGKRHTEAAIAKMRRAQRENPRVGARNHMFGNGHLVAGAHNPFFGRTHSVETKAKMRAAHAARAERKR